ncbi:MAG: hypothetical protein U0452_02345 [Anaerolineae bacterium]
MTNTNALDNAVRMWASTGDQAYLLNVLEEELRLIGDLQSHMAILEGHSPDDRYGPDAGEMDWIDDSDRTPFAPYEDFPARDDREDYDR